MPAQGTATGSVYTPPRRRARRTAARGVATPIPAASSSAASTGGFAGTHAASVGSASYHPAVALAASHSGAVLARVMHGLDPALRSLLPSAVALAHHENLPASLLVGIAQANGTAHTKGLVNVARRLKANDFHAAPHAALEKVTGNVAGALKAAQQLHPLDKVPNPHAAYPASKPPVFRSEGNYPKAYARNRPLAKAPTTVRGLSSGAVIGRQQAVTGRRPYQTPLTRTQEQGFKSWLRAAGVKESPDYDYRGLYKATGGKPHKPGTHFPDTFKTPYDTTFSRQSKYANRRNPLDWQGNRLVNVNTGRTIFANLPSAGGPKPSQDGAAPKIAAAWRSEVHPGTPVYRYFQQHGFPKDVLASGGQRAAHTPTIRAPMGADASLRRTLARVAPSSRRPPALTGGTAVPREVGIGTAPNQKPSKATRRTRRAVRAVAGLGPDAAVLARTDVRLAKRFGIPASVLFNQQGIESGFGANTGPSSAGALGDTQFIKGTRDSILQKYGVDAWASPQQAARAQALLLRDSGYSKSPQQAVYSYNHSTAYVNDVLSGAKQYKVLDKIAAGHGSPYVYPFDPHKIQVGRIDQGQDFSGGGPIRAIGRARYIGQGQGPAWASGGGGGTGQGLLYKLTRGPQKGRYVFVYEGIATKAGLKPGQKLHKGQVIGKVLPSPASLEIGFADSSGTPISHATYVEGQETQGGKAMARFLSTIKSGGGIPIGGFGPSSGGFVGLSGSAPATSGVAAETMGAFSGPAAHQGRGGGGAGSLTPQLAALLPENYRAGAAGAQPSTLADQLRSEARPKRRLTTGR